MRLGVNVPVFYTDDALTKGKTALFIFVLRSGTSLKYTHLDMSNSTCKPWRPEELFIDQALTKIASEQHRDVETLSAEYYAQELSKNGGAFDHIVRACVRMSQRDSTHFYATDKETPKVYYGDPDVNEGVPDLSFLNRDSTGNPEEIVFSEMREELKALVMWWFQRGEGIPERCTISPHKVNAICIDGTFRPLLFLINSKPNEKQSMVVNLALPMLCANVLAGVRLQLSDTLLCAKRELRKAQLYKFGKYAFTVAVVGALVYWVVTPDRLDREGVSTEYSFSSAAISTIDETTRVSEPLWSRVKFLPQETSSRVRTTRRHL